MKNYNLSYHLDEGHCYKGSKRAAFIVFINTMLFIILSTFINIKAEAQHNFITPPQPNTIYNSAYQQKGPYYILTPERNSQVASIWSGSQFDLNTVFDSTFYLYFGQQDSRFSLGADGIVFVFQTKTNPNITRGYPIGEGGGYIGFSSYNNNPSVSITPSINIEFDTYYNPFNPSNIDTLTSLLEVDHIDIFANGIMDSNGTRRSLIGGPVAASSSSINIEDNSCHKIRVRWVPDNDGTLPNTSTLSVYFDDMVSPRVALNRDIRTDLGLSAWWGFTSATGGTINLQYLSFLDVPDTSISCDSIVLGNSLFNDTTGKIHYQWRLPNGTIKYSRLITAIQTGKHVVSMSYSDSIDKDGDPLTPKIWYDFCTINDTVNVLIKQCCRTCGELIQNGASSIVNNMIDYKGSTDSSCCYHYKDEYIDPDIFKCLPFGVKIYDKSFPHTVYAYHFGGNMFTDTSFHRGAGSLDFCISKNEFVGGQKILVTEYLNADNQVMCSILDTVKSCFSDTCDCKTWVPWEPNTPITVAIRDTFNANPNFCCFYLKYPPYSCPFYGIRVYSSSKQVFMDTLHNKPISGQGIPPLFSFNKFCVPRKVFNGGSITVRIEFLDALGGIICAKNETIQCSSCCDDMEVKDEPSSLIGDACSGKILFGIPENASACGIVGFKSNVILMGYPRPGYITSAMYPYCLSPGETKTYTGYFVNKNGDTICQKSVTVSCPPSACCDGLKVALDNSSPYLYPCCYNLLLNRSTCLNCDDIYTIRWLNGDIILQGSHIMSSIPPLGTPPLKTGFICNLSLYPIVTMIEFLDRFGKVICSKPVELSGCTIFVIGEKLKRTADSAYDNELGLALIPNPAKEEVFVSYSLRTRSTVNIKVTDISGRVLLETEQPSEEGSNRQRIGLSDFSVGVYFVTIEQNGVTQTEKLVIKH